MNKSILIILSLVGIFTVGGVGMFASFFDSELTNSNISYTATSKETACQINGGGVGIYPIQCIGTPEQCTQTSLVITTCGISGGKDSCETVGGTYTTFRSTCWDVDYYKIIWNNGSSQIQYDRFGHLCGASISSRCILNNDASELYFSPVPSPANSIVNITKTK